ncbi:MAG: electron transfer flavoprotein subunit beta/FixA family protein [Desulfobacterales bacterium]|nr:electron transfer flavoprotein subunit beta/FixA family protein [Desulfobacterales bacterium]
MNIVVLIKQVVDVELNIRVKNDTLVEEGLTYVISNWDEIAIETAIQIVESLGEGTITLISIGPDRVQDALRRGLAMGADKAIHVLDTAFDGSDSFAYAKTFAKMLENQDYDIILGGKQAQDTDAGLTMSMLAEFMNLPQVTNVSRIVSVGKDQCTFHRRGDHGSEVIELSLPAVLTVNDSLFEPRLATLRGMMLAKKKPIETVSLADIAVDPGLAGAAGRQTAVNRLIPPETRNAGQLFDGEEESSTKQVMELLLKDEIGQEHLLS